MVLVMFLHVRRMASFITTRVLTKSSYFLRTLAHQDKKPQASCGSFKVFSNGNGDVELTKNYYVLAYVLYKDKGELFRLNLGAPKTFVAEGILKVNYPFEYSTFPNIAVLHNYTKSCMETSKKFTPVREWLHLNRNSV
ncbi:hypothetical protein Glove_149g57 [Diversispora epigaea]|uniref:Uncharacterized protein n=1 Tax=Diversispora epigaea TaxID=1348612 RepID=A0A397ITH8_9GLOM|nr:hypothetical protein Glove_149g57 [Diversispora epigaea]